MCVKNIEIVDNLMIHQGGNDTKEENSLLEGTYMRTLRHYRLGQRKEIQDYLTNNDVKKICKFLKNPTSCGLWVLKGTWLGNKGITHEVIKELTANEELKKKLKEKDWKNILKKGSRELRKITDILMLFVYMNYSNPDDREKYNYSDVGLSAQPLIENLDFKGFRKKHSKELSYFKNQILVEGFVPRVTENEFLYTRSGLVLYRSQEIVDEKVQKKTFWMMSLEAGPLEKLASFFDSLGKISDYTIYPIYSPEEAVLEPYVSFLNLGKEKFLEKGKIRSLIDQSISIFGGKNYPYCISTIGLVLEEQITQIYETLFRKKCQQELMLGELVDLIRREVRKKFEVVEPKKMVDFGNMYKRINELLKETPSENKTVKDILTINRDILTLIRENNKRFLPKPSSSQKSESLSIFPKNLREGIDELIMYRNAISHRSRIPIGRFEAVKSIFHISSLIMWWEDEKKAINWKEKPDTIIVEMVKRNNPRVTSHS